MSSREELSHDVKAMAIALGADAVGICQARATPESERLGAWLDCGFAGVMGYLDRTRDKRQDPATLFEGARSMIAVGLVYGGDTHESGKAASPTIGRVSRYAVGDDYHDVLGDRLRALAAGIEAHIGRAVRYRAYVDTGPVIERLAAARAGLGWVGKNTCLIHPTLGSYLFLGVLVTDLDCAFDVPVPEACGTCTACLDACPTDALVAPRWLDATRCIAYTTIEDPGPIPETLRVAHGQHVYGCDVCQDVCPWNHRRAREIPTDALGLKTRLRARPQWREPSLAWMLALEEDAWRAATTASAMRRGKRRGLVRNALVAAGNSGDETLRPAIERLAKGEDALLAEHAVWALARLSQSKG